MMRVVVNGVATSVAGEPEQTLLDSLRLDLGLTGTKEGCRSGDCGACTVLVRESEQSSFYPVNSCILPLGQLEGQEVLTVEGLMRGSELHPVQAALINHHGSQCGFCTPGFVMAISGWLDRQNHTETGDHLTTHTLQEAIAGNLCRCTGYRPILEAVRAAAQAPLPVLGEVRDVSAGHEPSDQTPSNDAQILRSARADLSASAVGEQEMERLAPFRIALEHSLGMTRGFYEPVDLASLHLVLSALPNATLIAGGTDLMLSVTQSGEMLGNIVSLSKVQAIKTLELSKNTGVIGAGLSYSDLMESAKIAWPELHRFLSRLGSPQIRNRGTVGGNLGTASPIGDMLPILLAMDGEVIISSAKGAVRSLSVGEFIQGYRQTALSHDEYIREVRVEGLQDFHRYYKVSKRQEDDIASVSVAVRIQIENQLIRDVRLAVGGVADRALRLLDLEGQFIGKTLTEAQAFDFLGPMGEAISPISDVRASAAYRTAVTAGLVQRAMMEAAGNPMATIYEAASNA
jgi:xanthine dehydrogenase small subunit